MTRGSDQSDAMRARLASVGIFLDEPKPAAKPARSTSADVNPDREAIREILVAAGAPDHDLEWLVNSCPNVDAARTYQPPRNIERAPSES